MAFSDLARQTVDSVYASLGESAVYFPCGKPSMAVTVMPLQRQSEVPGFGRTGHIHAGFRCEVRQAEIGQKPTTGDKIQVAGTVYEVRKVKHGDENQLTFELDCVPG